jgi:hypothetical protein
MGIGDAYIGLVDFLSNYGKFTYKDEQIMKLTISSEDCTDPDSVIECLIGFVAETTIQSIKRPTDDTIAHWYHAVNYTPHRLTECRLTSTLTALQNLRQEQPLRLGPIPSTQTPPQAGQPRQVFRKLTRRHARSTHKRRAGLSHRKERGVRGDERCLQPC